MATFLGDTGNIFFPKLDFHKHQIYFKEIALDFLKVNDFEPELVQSEKEAKEFDFDEEPVQDTLFIFPRQILQEKKRMKSFLLKRKIMKLISTIL